MADLTTAARPYARAVFELAQASGQYDDWSSRLAFWSSVSNDDDMDRRLHQPGLTASDKAGLLEAVSDGLDDQSRNFLHLLAENGRLELLPDIATIYEGMRQDTEGKVEAKVISAYALTDKQRSKISAALAKRLGREVSIDNEVDKDLVGGAIIRVGDLVIDGTVRGHLEKMERAVVG
ncbi:MAG: F0F1 ATP synthase subunit delta [Gammaproteobacteria bacterium]|nr:MAG: F0F1 ATP synthase subunit delta [Gammaproteobacteria bacterium]PIE37566.1 MAG: F0F1 ATP synthase subunit delta [Gammaproteobacteria bacterium]